jgi:hypothetical protein
LYADHAALAPGQIELQGNVRSGHVTAAKSVSELQPVAPVERADGPESNRVPESSPSVSAVRDLGEAPFGAFQGFDADGYDTFVTTRKTDGMTVEIKTVYPKGSVVARFESATVFADRGARVGDRFRFEGNVRIPELWGDDESNDVVELGPKLPEWYKFGELPDRASTSAKANPRAKRQSLADRQHDIGSSRRKGSRRPF